MKLPTHSPPDSQSLSCSKAEDSSKALTILVILGCPPQVVWAKASAQLELRVWLALIGPHLHRDSRAARSREGGTATGVGP